MKLISERVLAGDRRALAHVITTIEDRRNGYLDILKELYPRGGHARLIGITGSPGSGKSTLVNQLIGAYRERSLSVAVVAIDPSSAFSGGAILGDRIRMQDKALDEGVFIRSMATRGHMGGLATATGDVLTALDAAGFDVILVETVGVGQDEVDIVREADTVLVLLVPGLGDDIQAIKAGIMEIADVFVVNKADHAGVDRVERELHAAMTLGGAPLAWMPPVVKTVATSGSGVTALLNAIDEHAGHLAESGAAEERQRLKYRLRFKDLLAEGFLLGVSRHWLAEEEEDRLLEAFIKRKSDPYSVVEAILDRVQWEKRP